MTTSKQRIPCLDGLRAVSILLVLAGHSSNTVALHGGWQPVILPVLTNAFLGVLVFFVISGYLITSLLNAEWQRTQTIDMRGFYVRRVWRIFPAFYAYIAVVCVLAAAGVLIVAPNQLLSAATFLWNYRHLWNHIDDAANWFPGHFWTLSLEEPFYWLWPLILLLCTPDRAAWVAFALIVLSPPLRVATYVLWPSARAQIGLISPYLGMAFRGAYQITVGTTLEAFAITVLMLWLVRHPESGAGRLLQRRFVVHVGVLSYSLYIWQQFFLTPLNKTWTGRFPCNLLAALVVAEASHRFLERPFLRWRRRTVPPLPGDALP